MARTILVTGVTGQQGLSLITALRPDENTDSEKYHVLALTRNKASLLAQALAQEKHVDVVEGDLNKPLSIVRIFEYAKENQGGIWGVFMVLAFPGLRKNADAEETQGKVFIFYSILSKLK